jgi:transcriptional regulator with GAF, ATPase, and Fis domain
MGMVRKSATRFTKKTARLQAARVGPLFVDEVGEIPLELQTKLLRVFRRGNTSGWERKPPEKVKVRIIAATNRKLAQEVEAGRFLQDLYYRLNVFPIEVAPPRNRKEDITLLATPFMSHVLKKRCYIQK